MTEPITPQMLPPESGVTVRMYRVGGLGDCFLLAFRSKDSSPVYMLIDCGVIIGTPNGANRFRTVAADINLATGGRIHFLVATHEHWDHLSGFQYAQSVFNEMQIDEAWFAWTENPDHPLANKLRQKREITMRALAAVSARLHNLNSPRADLLDGVLGFHGDFSATSFTGTSGQLAFIQEKANTVRYLRPVEPPITPVDLSGVRIFVLGPPEDETLLTKSAPSGEEGEVYERPAALNSAAAFYAAVLTLDEPDDHASLEWDQFNRSLPFDHKTGIRINEAASHEAYSDYFTQYYGFLNGPQEGHGPEWRRIDHDWLGVAESLALKLDSDTNNTSLVLAIEIPDGKVLLFPGDAQVGNWLSWHDLSWPDDQRCTVTTSNLLERTVLYKVGHHGSHNATLRDKGLEMMTRSDLVAMIPVHAEHAKKRKWSMPFPTLHERLKEKTYGRILYSDLGIPPKPDTVQPSQWDLFKTRARQDTSPDQLWVEFDVTYE